MHLSPAGKPLSEVCGPHTEVSPLFYLLQGLKPWWQLEGERRCMCVQKASSESC